MSLVMILINIIVILINTRIRIITTLIFILIRASVKNLKEFADETDFKMLLDKIDKAPK